MTVYRSFSATWLSFAKGEIKEETLLASDTVLVFNCEREHIYPKVKDNTLPAEVAWTIPYSQRIALGMNNVDARVSVSILSAKLLSKWFNFYHILKPLNNRGALVFRGESQRFRVSVKGAAVDAIESAIEHGCDTCIVISNRDGEENPSTIMTVGANLLILGFWFNESSHCQGPVPVGGLLYYGAEQ